MWHGEVSECDSKRQAHLEIAPLIDPTERRAQVVRFGHELGHPLHPAQGDVTVRIFTEGAESAGVRISDGGFFTALGQPLQPKFSDRLQHPEAWLPAASDFLSKEAVLD